ncbi:hypothetical protein [Streptomyces sp. CAU 1734]|uniref:hypothetical protein n=1 Tax=Streptomyces sp. CAU 1734 TaxID=3140360 RepID=UPI0032616DED
MSIQNYNVAEAAEMLRCKPSFLEENLKRFPHQRLGRSVAFDETELTAIKNMCRVLPVENATPADSTPELTLATIQPKQRRSRTG